MLLISYTVQNLLAQSSGELGEKMQKYGAKSGG